MSPHSTAAAAWVIALAAVALLPDASRAEPPSEPGKPPFERTEQREPCAQHDPLRQPLFGDLRVNSFADDCLAQADTQNARAQERGAQGDVYGKCCLSEAEEPFYSPVIQERAWTSPIWYEPTVDGDVG